MGTLTHFMRTHHNKMVALLKSINLLKNMIMMIDLKIIHLILQMVIKAHMMGIIIKKITVLVVQDLMITEDQDGDLQNLEEISEEESFKDLLLDKDKIDKEGSEEDLLMETVLIRFTLQGIKDKEAAYLLLTRFQMTIPQTHGLTCITLIGQNAVLTVF